MPDASQHSDDANVYVATYYVFQVIDADKPTQQGGAFRARHLAHFRLLRSGLSAFWPFHARDMDSTQEVQSHRVVGILVAASPTVKSR